MRLANKGISSFNRGRIRAEGQGLVLPALHDAPPTSHLSSTLIIIHYSIFISHPQAAESSVCNGQFAKGGVPFGCCATFQVHCVFTNPTVLPAEVRRSEFQRIQDRRS